MSKNAGNGSILPSLLAPTNYEVMDHVAVVLLVICESVDLFVGVCNAVDVRDVVLRFLVFDLVLFPSQVGACLIFPWSLRKPVLFNNQQITTLILDRGVILQRTMIIRFGFLLLSNNHLA